MKKNNNILKKIGMIWIILSLVFIIPINSNLIFSAGDNFASNEKINTVCGGFTDVRNSLLLSVVTMCLPGILEKTNEWKQIKCQTAVCYYDAVKNNLDPSFCIKQQEYRTCSYIVGDVFALPGLNMFDKFRQTVADILANPAGTALSVATQYARAITKGSCIGASLGLCNFKNPPYVGAAIFLVIVDGSSIVQQIQDVFKNGFFPPLTTKSSCDRLPDIKKEMDQILKFA